MQDSRQITGDVSEKTQGSVIKLKSNSKINFGLWIKEKRPDNYHEIETVFFENESLFDEIQIEYKAWNELQVKVGFTDPTLNTLLSQYNNLAYKAAVLFFEKLDANGKCNITINKKIPFDAGLGGGSSNAACVLRGLNSMLNYKLSENELLALASQIGSDVPFFILGKTCLGKGRGEILTELENKLNLEIKIVKPNNISISTKWAYEQIDSREFLACHKKEIDNLTLAMKEENYDLFFNSIFNDFEMVAFSFYPELIRERKKLLEEGYKAVCLCGSGSALFGIRERNKKHET